MSMYCGEVLYNDEDKEIPPDIEQKLGKIHSLFPQEHDQEDDFVYEKNQNMGLIVDQWDAESNSKVSGMVKKEICSNPEYHRWLECKYIVFKQSDLKLEVWEEEEVNKNHCIGWYGSFGSGF